jgi:hypothetical protein
MRKQDIVEGQEYVAAEGRDYWYSIKRVRVVENDIYHARRPSEVPASVVYNDEEYQRAHERWSLADAFPHDTTPREKREADYALRSMKQDAQTRWLNADRRRMFAKGSGWSSFSTEGIICEVRREDKSAERILVPRKNIRETWTDYEARQVMEKRRLAAKEIAAANEEFKRNRLRPVVQDVLEAAGIQMYLSKYQGTVTLSYEQVLTLVGKDA